MNDQRVIGTRTENDLDDQERRSLNSSRQQWLDAREKATATGEDVNMIDLARTPVCFDVYWAEACWLKYQNELARLGLDWIAPGTSERTADGKKIEHGLRVWTNDLERGVIDLSRADWSNARGDRKSLWFDVVLETGYDGQPKTGKALQNAERVTTRFKGQDA